MVRHCFTVCWTGTDETWEAAIGNVMTTGVDG